MSKSEEYRDKAGEHIKLAASSESAEVRQMHADMAESFLSLAERYGANGLVRATGLSATVAIGISSCRQRQLVGPHLNPAISPVIIGEMSKALARIRERDIERPAFNVQAVIENALKSAGLMK